MKDRVDELKEKRALLKRKIKHEERMSLISDLLSLLETESVWHEVNIDELDDPHSPRSWVLSSYDFLSWGRIDGGYLECPSCLKVDDFESYDDAFKALVAKNEITADVVYVFWTNSERPVLQLKLNDFINYVSEVFAEDWDAWVFSPEQGWCVEYHHDGDLCFYQKLEPS